MTDACHSRMVWPEIRLTKDRSTGKVDGARVSHSSGYPHLISECTGSGPAPSNLVGLPMLLGDSQRWLKCWVSAIPVGFSDGVIFSWLLPCTLLVKSIWRVNLQHRVNSKSPCLQVTVIQINKCSLLFCLNECQVLYQLQGQWATLPTSNVLYREKVSSNPNPMWMWTNC